MVEVHTSTSLDIKRKYEDLLYCDDFSYFVVIRDNSDLKLSKNCLNYRF